MTRRKSPWFKGLTLNDRTHAVFLLLASTAHAPGEPLKWTGERLAVLERDADARAALDDPDATFAAVRLFLHRHRASATA